MKILHIATHLGGGVGTVLINWAISDKKNKHSFMCLGYNYETVINRCADNNIELDIHVSHGNVVERIISDQPDVVVLHYWNHPLLVEFLVQAELPPCRLVVYSHIAGMSAPYVIPDKLYEYADEFIYSSISSKGASDLNTIMSTGGVERLENLKKEDHVGFNVIYIGTLDFAKLRHDFVDICHGIIKRTNSDIIVCGEGDSEYEIRGRVKELGLENRFKFTGLVEDIAPYLKVSDVLLYPLTDSHYGTGEQVIGEAMICGTIPVVFNNPCEASLVDNLKTGMVVENTKACIEAVVELKNNPLLRTRLLTAAKKSAKEMYSQELFISKWDSVFGKVLEKTKRRRYWETWRSYSLGMTIFLESLGNEGRAFRNQIEADIEVEDLLKSSLQWKSKSKGSIYQYLKHFPEDEYLNKLKNIIEG